MSFPTSSLSPAEQTALAAAAREGSPFLAYRDALGDLRIVHLPAAGRVRIGRTLDNDIVLDTDPEVSRAHAQLEQAGGGWTLVDDATSRNGSFVNERQIVRHQRLEDHDTVRVGRTTMLFRAPGPAVAESTVVAYAGAATRLTDAERRVLVALCQPLLEPGRVAAPASNGQIAEAMHLSLPGVKTHIRSLFRKLGVDELPQNQKRAELARRGLDTGMVTARDLTP